MDSDENCRPWMKKVFVYEHFCQCNKELDHYTEFVVYPPIPSLDVFSLPDSKRNFTVYE